MGESIEQLMNKLYTFAAALIAASTYTSAVKVTEDAVAPGQGNNFASLGIQLEGTEAAEFLASAGVDLSTVSTTQGNSTEGITTFVYIYECNNCVIQGGNSTEPITQPEPEDPGYQPTMEDIAGVYEWKHDGVHTDGLLTLHADGRLDQYHWWMEDCTWELLENGQVRLYWPGDHTLTWQDDTEDWAMLSRNPPSRMVWSHPYIPV